MREKISIHVFGGSGFIGTALLTRFKIRTDFMPKIYDRRPSLLFDELTSICDIRFHDTIKLETLENSVIINLAAEHRDDVSPKSLYDEVNVDGAVNICKVAREKNVQKIIFTSSVAVYGFAPVGTSESGSIIPFNDYGRTKWEAEQIYGSWQAEDPKNRTLVIIRPTVVFGERNRGNVFNLLKQISSGRFLMIGNGQNRKSIAYVENVAAFIEYSLNFNPGVHVYNYIDKPDFTMSELVSRVKNILGRPARSCFRLPYFFGLAIGNCFDLIAFLTRKKLAISSIRVKKFCANSVYESAVSKTGFVPPVDLPEAIERTVKYEFLEDHKKEPIYYSE